MTREDVIARFSQPSEETVAPVRRPTKITLRNAETGEEIVIRRCPDCATWIQHARDIWAECPVCCLVSYG